MPSRFGERRGRRLMTLLRDGQEPLELWIAAQWIEPRIATKRGGAGESGVDDPSE